MSNNDNGLYDFIKGKSLFSPTNKANRKRSRSRSRGPRDFDRNSNAPAPELNDPRNNPLFNNRNFNEQPQRNYSPVDLAKQQPTYPQSNYPTQSNYPSQSNYPTQSNYPSQSNYPPQTSFAAQQSTQGGFQNTQGGFGSLQQNTYSPATQPSYPAPRLNQDPETASMRWGQTASQVSQMSQNSVWTGILSYSNSFESARVESSQCLENLSLKIRRELANIHTKIDTFNARMTAVLANEFRVVREKVQAVLEAAFKESDKYVQEYMKTKEATLAGEMHQMKALLEKELNRVEVMKDELAKPTWRKVAGEILTTELEHKVEELLQKSSALEVGKWELGDLAGYRIKNIQNQLREIVRLKA